MMNRFLSCDWGTSSFRLRLVDVDNFKVLAEETSGDGIAPTYALWQVNGQPEEKRISFYLEVLKMHIRGLESKAGISLTGTPVKISGMASSTIGFIDLPYTTLPVNVKDANIHTVSLPASNYFEHEVLVISGITVNDDVIRGEETQLIGCADMIPEKIADEIFIFPGTHSKHIHVLDNEVETIKTYMTGEFFELLSQKSILKNSIEKDDILKRMAYLESFKTGVHDALNINMLNAAFKVRTNNLFGKLTKEENYCYLSGLLIGNELKELTASSAKKITLVGGGRLSDLYNYALQQLALPTIIQTFDAVQADETIIRGQYKIYKRSLV